ncbi:MAG: hypothetical protein U0930_23535 [Pirellulales bacterium]
MHRINVCLALAVSLLVGSTASAQQQNLAELGLSKAKPAEGPSVEVGGQFMVPYKLVIPGTLVSIEMIPVPGGVFEMG